VYVRDVERQQIDLDALARLNGEREGARSRPNSPGRAGRAEETRPAIHHRFSATTAPSSCTAGVGPDHVVANSVSLSLHSPESPAYGETTKVLLRYSARDQTREKGDRQSLDSQSSGQFLYGDGQTFS
jgi:hypothetical protein